MNLRGKLVYPFFVRLDQDVEMEVYQLFLSKYGLKRKEASQKQTKETEGHPVDILQHASGVLIIAGLQTVMM